MKYVLVCMLMLPLPATAQSKKDYKEVMGKFVAYYNEGNIDKICTLFTPHRDIGCFWRWAQERSTDTTGQPGKILSYQYLGKDKTDEGKVTVFRIETEKQGVKAMSFTLEPGNKFGTFRFITSSDEIDRMLATYKP